MSTRDAYHRIRRAGYILRVVEVEGEVKLRVSKPPHPAEELRDYIKEHRDELITHIEREMLGTESEVFGIEDRGGSSLNAITTLIVMESLGYSFRVTGVFDQRRIRVNGPRRPSSDLECNIRRNRNGLISLIEEGVSFRKAGAA